MPRNSEIDRAGLGGRVLELAGNGDTAPMIAAAITPANAGNEISTASVRRYLAKQSVNAAIPSESSAMKLLVAAISGMPDTRDSKTSSYYGLYKLNTTNAFTQYYGIARGIKNGQVLRAFKNIALKLTNGARIVGDERDAEKIAALSADINFSSLLQNVVRYTCEMGTCIVGLKSDAGESVLPAILPMQYYSLLTDRETPGTVTDDLVHGTVSTIAFDETGVAPKTFERDDMGLFRLWSDGHEMQDISRRSTFGIYGESMTLGVETPLKSLLNSSYYYDMFIQDFGLGRYVQNMKMLAQMLLDQKVTPEYAVKQQDATVAAMQQMQPDENIVTVGDEIHMMDSRVGFDIMPFLNWRGKQIDRTLLQSDVGSGDVGSSWTSSGTAVSAQDYDTYNSLRGALFEMFMTEIIVPRCESSEFALDPKTLSIAATPFLKIDVPFPDLIELHDRGIITEPELRDRAGFPVEKPDND